MTHVAARFMRLSVSALLVASFVYPLLSPARAAALTGITGTGTISDPYQITDCSQLGEVNNDLSGQYVLNNDIDCSAVTAGPTTFPIGSASNFSGSFDGQGHAITGLEMNLPGADMVGLFARLGSSAIVQKLSVTATINTGTNAGILAGRMDSNSHVDQVDTHGSVTCTNNCGGIAGAMHNSSSISRGWSDAPVGGSGYTYGGLVGWVNGSSVNISDVYYRGDVAPSGGSSDNTGGIVGFANNMALTNAYSTGTVSGGHGVGGIIGTLVSSNVINTFTTSHVSGVGMGPVFGDSILSTTTDNYYYDQYSMPSDGYGSTGVADTQEFIQNDTSPVFSTWSFSAAWVVDYQDYPALRPVQAPVMLCEEAVSTDTTASAHCFVSPRGWGIPTWQARYRQQGSSTWNTLTLNDAHIGQTSVSGLQPGTWYDVQLRYTNDYGTSPWGTVQILTTGTAPVAATGQTGGATATKAASAAKASAAAAVLNVVPITSAVADPVVDPAPAADAVAETIAGGSDATTKALATPASDNQGAKNASATSPVTPWLVGVVMVVLIGWLIISARAKRAKS